MRSRPGILPIRRGKGAGPGKRAFQICWKRALHDNLRSVLRMRKGKTPRVKKLSPDPEWIAPTAAVDRITGDGEADIFEMNAYLVSAAGLEANIDERKSTDDLKASNVGHGVAPVHRGRRHARPNASVAADWSVNRHRRRGRAMHKCEVAALDFAFPELSLKFAVGAGCASDDDEAARVTIEAVHDTGTHGVVPTCDRPAEKRVNERAAGVTGTRVGRHSRGLLGDKEMRILVVNRDRRIVRNEMVKERLDWLRLGANDLTGANEMALRHTLSVDRNHTGVEPTLRFSPTRRKPHARQELVESLSRFALDDPVCDHVAVISHRPGRPRFSRGRTQSRVPHR